MDDVIGRVETVASQAMRQLAQRPHVGGKPVIEPPPGSAAVMAPEIGYVTHIDVAALEEIAAKAEVRIVVAVLPGAFVTGDRAIAWLAGDDEGVADCFTIERTRAFDQDPRFGLVVLSEIASRAMSPAVNDPGTAIAVINAGIRVLSQLVDEPSRPPVAPHVHIPGVLLADLIEDFFRPIARDGAGNVEVGIRLQKAMASIAASIPEADALLSATADDALARAAVAIDHPADLAAVRAAHARCW